MRRINRAIATIVWAAQLTLWTTVPLLDVGIFEAGAVLYSPGERPGDYRDHDHDICIQYFANQSVPASAPVLVLVLSVATLPEWAAAWVGPDPTVPLPSARDPPLA